MKRFKYTILLATIILIFVCVVAWQVNRWRDCSSRGGDYVQGAFGYTCIGD